MIITVFPNTLGGVSFEKAGKLFGGRKTELFRCVVFPSPKPPTFPGNDQRGFPFGNPKLMFYFRFLFFLLVLIFFSFFLGKKYYNKNCQTFLKMFNNITTKICVFRISSVQYMKALI